MGTIQTLNDTEGLQLLGFVITEEQNHTKGSWNFFLEFCVSLQISMAREQRFEAPKLQSNFQCPEHASVQQQTIFQEPTNFIQLSWLLLGASRDQDGTCEQNSKSIFSAL